MILKQDSMKQTAVEWFIKELRKNRIVIPMEMEQQAKEMEKEQIVNFADKYDAYIVQGGTLTAEQYYNETFKSE
jgi:hypothetical protein